ncbi:MAG: transcription antitermination factor NusB [Rhodospirillaceae bacterium]
MSERTYTVGRRSAARLAAVQALYEIDMVGAPATPVLKEFLERRWSDASPVDREDDDGSDDGAQAPAPEQRLLKRLVNGVAADPDGLDAMIAQHLNSPWTAERLDTLMRAILRAGAYEIRDCPGVAARTVIAEYVGLAHAFFGENEPALVNGVLDGMARQFRPDEMAGRAAG